jgi:transcriptional regulator with XRE-family HTH domain
MPKVSLRSEVVREHLARRNISQNHLALKLGVSRGYLSQLLHHQRHPGPDVRERLMDALRVQDFDVLFKLVPGSTLEGGQ